MISKLSEINKTANPPLTTGNRSNWEREQSGFINYSRKPISVKLSKEQCDYLIDVVRTGKFLSRSEAIRYAIQFCMDLEKGLTGIVNQILEMKK